MRPVSLLLLGALAACGQAVREEPANTADPAIADAINDPIMVDPQLSVQSGGGPALVAVPADATAEVADDLPTLGQVAVRTVAIPAYRGCGAKIDYAMTWMGRLPADLSAPENSMVAETAGSDSPACQLRIVRFATTVPIDRIAAHYRDVAKRAGYSVSKDAKGLQARRSKDGAAFSVTMTPTKTGSSVDFITNRGR